MGGGLWRRRTGGGVDVTIDGHGDEAEVGVAGRGGQAKEENESGRRLVEYGREEGVRRVYVYIEAMDEDFWIQGSKPTLSATRTGTYAGFCRDTEIERGLLDNQSRLPNIAFASLDSTWNILLPARTHLSASVRSSRSGQPSPIFRLPPSSPDAATPPDRRFDNGADSHHPPPAGTPRLRPWSISPGLRGRPTRLYTPPGARLVSGLEDSERTGHWHSNGGSVPRGLWPFYPNMAIQSTNRPRRRACPGLDARAGTHRGNMAILASDDPSSDDALENGPATARAARPPPSRSRRGGR